MVKVNFTKNDMSSIQVRLNYVFEWMVLIFAQIS